MKGPLIGASLERDAMVSPEMATDFLGDADARVLATPHLIWGLEFAARDAILPLLDATEDSVGTQIHVTHLAATPIGMRVVFRARVVSVDGRFVTFNCEAFDAIEKIAEGTHERAVINVSRFANKLKAKAALVLVPEKDSGEPLA